VPTEYLLSALLLLIAAFVIFRVIVRRDFRRRGRLSWASTLLESMIWGPCFGFPSTYNPPSWPAFWLRDRDIHPWLRYAGIILIVVGITLTFAAMASLGLRRSLGQEVSAWC
jgi:uncharacterized membrane protein HdeD (DUF308 family)